MRPKPKLLLMKTEHRYEEIDISIPNMDSPELEKIARGVLENRRGIYAVRIIERGAWIEYEPTAISREHVYGLLRDAGFEVEMFQESQTGATGVSSV